jgi:putative Holliday junction resolvase
MCYFTVMRILGIDYGTKRVGVAMSDPHSKFALPHTVIQNSLELLAEVVKIAKDNQIQEIVMGESRDYNNQPNDILLKSLEFKKQLEGEGFKVILEPEFMTSVHAERFQGKNEKIDSSAAALILQSYLDRNRDDSDLGE